MRPWQRLQAWLTTGVDPLPLAAFRVVFGLAMMGWVAHYLWPDRVWAYYIAPRFHFTYQGFEWVQPWGPFAMYRHFYAMAAAAFLVAIGLCYRVAIAAFALLYTFVFLLDKTPYNNHYWLIILVSVLLCFMDAASVFSVDALWRKRLPDAVPRWNLVLIKAQVLMVYFFGGVAKINEDWILRGLPLRIWLLQRSDWPAVGELFKEEWLARSMSILGLVFDLGIGPLLLWRRTRPIAVVLVVGFHACNQMLFSIGIFHALMLFGTVLFVEPATLRRVHARLTSWVRARPRVPMRPWMPASVVTALVVLHLGVQVVLPFQRLLYPGNFAWTEEGRDFAWQIKARDKAVRGSMTVQDGDGEPVVLDVERYLSKMQVRQMYRRPDMLWQFARFIAAEERRRGMAHPVVKARVEASVNGRPYALLVDPDVNLAAEEYPPFSHARFILPMPDVEPVLVGIGPDSQVLAGE